MSDTPDSLIERWREAAGDKKIVLHIGCGAKGSSQLYSRYTTPEWHEIRVDVSAEAAPDLTADIRDLSAISDQSIDAIWVSRTLEHIDAHEVAAALAECNRILKENGEMGACVPDLPAISAHIANGRLEEPLYETQAGTNVRPLDLLYGLENEVANGNAHMAHRTGFSAETLVHKTRAAGFSAITVMRKELHLWLGSFKYPEGHPKKAEKSRIITDKVPEMPPAPPLGRNNHPGMMHAGKLPDELNVPPKMWDMA